MLQQLDDAKFQWWASSRSPEAVQPARPADGRSLPACCPVLLSASDEIVCSLRFHVKAVLISGVGFFTDAYDLFAVSIIVPMVAFARWPDHEKLGERARCVAGHMNTGRPSSSIAAPSLHLPRPRHLIVDTPACPPSCRQASSKSHRFSSSLSARPCMRGIRPAIRPEGAAAAHTHATPPPACTAQLPLHQCHPQARSPTTWISRSRAWRWRARCAARWCLG